MVDKIPTIELDQSSDVPLWVQLHDRMAYLITSGFYEPGEKLPTVRKFAASLNIAYNTVSKAYMGLERDGFATTVRGSGVFVKNVINTDGVDEKLQSVMHDFVATCLDQGLVYDDIPVLVSDYIRTIKREHEEEVQKQRYE